MITRGRGVHVHADLGAAGHELDPRGVRAARERLGEVLRGVRRRGEPDHPLGLPRALRVRQTDNAK
jgi:hypothetical protein